MLACTPSCQSNPLEGLHGFGHCYLAYDMTTVTSILILWNSFPHRNITPSLQCHLAPCAYSSPCYVFRTILGPFFSSMSPQVQGLVILARTLIPNALIYNRYLGHHFELMFSPLKRLCDHTSVAVQQGLQGNPSSALFLSLEYIRDLDIEL